MKKVFLIIFIVIEITALLFFCAEKDGFHEDEGFTLTVNGNLEQNDFSVLSDEWKTPDS